MYIFSDTLFWVYKSMNLNIFLDLRKPGLVAGKSTNINSVIKKIKVYIVRDVCFSMVRYVLDVEMFFFVHLLLYRS